ncbi:hypothetical protein [Streptomyces melanosporofaciens]|uniref:Uncharacterized protein n=1 Tax=Streptomyces melanosporofaciens TaxID=67327 RepID=A0A1H4ICF2_STRMJ|nr:hypothetical protein [Streptomyces melanosporofaciens]SEB31759.1 hypothetical protein SAMN04490356_0504 [Streptomyces melanosporofaciens]
MPSNAAEERRLVDAVQIGDEFGLSPGRVNALHADRENTGFPAARPRKGRGGKQEWEYGGVAEYFANREASNRLANLTEDASGDPDELLNASQVAKELGYKNPNQITTYMRDHPGYFAEPDVVEHLGSEERPWTKMLWYRRTITAWRKERRGKGRREGNTRTAPALPEVAADGDPDELLVAPQAAALLGFKSVNTFSSSLSQGNLPLLKEDDGKVLGSRGRKSRAWTRRRVLEQKAARSSR